MFMWSSWPWQTATTVMFCCFLRCAAVSPLVWSINLYRGTVFIIHSRCWVPHVLCCPWEKDTVSLHFSQPKGERIILDESNFLSYAQPLKERSMVPVVLNDHHLAMSYENSGGNMTISSCKGITILDAYPLFVNFYILGSFYIAFHDLLSCQIIVQFVWTPPFSWQEREKLLWLGGVHAGGASAT